MDKLTISNPHPNLIMGMSEFQISDFIAELLQSLQDLEEQYGGEGGYKQFKKEQEQLKIFQEQLKKEQEQLTKDQEQLKKFQAFILKLSRQIEEAETDSRKHQEPLLKQRSGNNWF